MVLDINSSDLKYVYDGAILSNAIYFVKDTPKVEGFNLLHHHNGTVDEYRVSHWCIYTSADESTVYIVFRGSMSAMDWLVNISFIPLAHPLYPNVNVHSGYFSEIEREYEAIKTRLSHLIDALKCKGTSIEKIVISGHSKGGALAQLLTDKFFNDEDYWSNCPCLPDQLVCIAFSAPMIYWFRDIEHIHCVRSSVLCHNFIIKGDPVPVLQVILSETPASFYKMVENEVRRIPIVGGTVLASIRQHVDEIIPYVKGFKPVGTLYEATVVKLTDLQGVSFRHTSFNTGNMGEWDCISGVEFGFEYHAMVNHIQAAKQDYEAFYGAGDQKINARGRGLYVRNTTDEDILFVMSQVTPLHWARVPRKKTVFVLSGAVWFTIKVSKYDQKDEPTRAGVAAKIGLVSGLTVAVGIPLASTAIGLAMVGSRISRPSNPGKDTLSGVYANGRTVEVKKFIKDKIETEFFEISLKATEVTPRIENPSSA